jgi:hypothetical protein
MANGAAAGEPFKVDWILPPIKHTQNNPYLDKAVEAGKRTVSDIPAYGPKNPMSERDLDCNQGQNMVRLAELLCHPQSPMKGDQKLVKPLMTRFEAAIDAILNMQGRKNAYSFGSKDVMRTYAILLTVRPDLLTSPLRERAEQCFHKIAEDIIKKNPVFLKKDSSGSWVNGDMRYGEALMWAGILFDNKRYREAGEKTLDYVSRSFLKDGGFLYVGNVNETFTYHQENIQTLASYARFGGSTLAKRLIVESRNYYPLSIEPTGVAEYTTAACWKPYWNTSVGNIGAMIVADYTDCPLNAHVMALYTGGCTLFEASFYRPDLKVKFEDNYIAYDYNIGGPRGRFGCFSFSGTGREYGSEKRGKGSFAGCMVVDAPKQKGTDGAPWNLNAALHEAGVEIRSAPARKVYKRHSHHTNEGGGLYYSISYDDKNGVTVGKDCAALGTIYKLSRYNDNRPQPCTGRQTWLYTPERLVGLLEITPDTDLKAYSLSATFKLVSGRAHWGNRKTLTRDGNHYQYGKINLLIHKQTFAESVIRYEETYGGEGEKTGRLSILDKEGFKNKEGVLNTYKQGESLYVLVEAYPEDSAPARRIELVENTSTLKILEVTEENGKTYRVYHNLTAKARTVNVQADKALSLLPNGCKYRPSWLAQTEDRSVSEPTSLRSGSHDIEIPAYGVAVILSRNK